LESSILFIFIRFFVAFLVFTFSRIKLASFKRLDTDLFIYLFIYLFIGKLFVKRGLFTAVTSAICTSSFTVFCIKNFGNERNYKVRLLIACLTLAELSSTLQSCGSLFHALRVAVEIIFPRNPFWSGAGRFPLDLARV